MKYFKYKIPTIVLLCLTITGCTEQYAFKSSEFESILVIEGTITNEVKKQTISLSQVYELEETGPKFATGANVFVADDLGNQYQFVEKDTVYISLSEFRAEPGRKYQLKIRTKEGKNYISDEQTLTTETKIDNLTASVENMNEETGVQIYVNSYDPTNNSKYYRYEYTETYKIVAPKWSSFQTSMTTIPATPGQPASEIISLTPRTTESKTCFSSKNSDKILLTNTNNLSEDRVHFPIRFISDQNYIMSHRYSIYVKQYVQNFAAHTFYKTLRDMSTSENMFSPKQPGFFYGNITSVEDPTEKVIGFFDVSSVSSERIYFNYEDLFPNKPLPPYYEIDCSTAEYMDCDGPYPCQGGILRYNIRSKSLVYFSTKLGSYLMVKAACGDCTSFSSNIVPTFWVD